MKKLRLSILLIILISSSMLFAGNVSPEKARLVATAQYNMQSRVAGNIQDVHEIRGDGQVVMYAVTFREGGFVIVSADDSFYPIIGYSINGRYSADRQPEGYRGMMADYRDQILYLRNRQIEPTPEINRAWAALLEGKTLKDGGKGIAPLLPSTWNQDDPYNYLCPASSTGPGGNVYVGCVATAMSQIMLYWRWPLQGVGSYSYYQPPYGTISANFGNTTYNWNGMVNSCPNTLNLPVALIGFHTGVSVRMNYGPTGSGAQSSDVPYAARTYFKYSNQIQYQQRSSYTATAWESMVKEQIDLGYPVYYSGVESGASAGHAFVVDGYDDQTPRQFHFNFGWDGYLDGYFTLASAGGFNTQQALVRNFYPGTGYPYYTEDFTEIKDLVGTLEDGSGPVAAYLNNTSAKWLFNPQTEEDSVTSITISFTRFALEAGDYLKIYDGGDENAPLIGEYTGSSLPAQFTSSGNKVLLHFVTNGSGTAQGWLLNYTANRPIFCSGTKTYYEPAGTFDDGSGTFNYVGNSNCMYKITPQWASEVTVYFDYFESEAENDWLKIYDLKTQQLLATYSGVYPAGSPPPAVTSPSGQVYLIWKTNGAFNHKGWKLHYETLNVGVESRELMSEFHLWPNPANHLLNISFTVNQTQNIQIDMINPAGIQVFSESHASFSGNYEKQISVGNLPKGVYFLRVNGEKGVYNRKVVVQ